MPTLYDNFSQVKQYIEQEKPDLTSYVTKTELANASYATSSDLNDYLPLSGGTLSGNLFAGDQEKTTVTFLGTRRKCGVESGTSYMASFFTNSDGRSKFTHKSYTGTKLDVSSDVDDAFMCFNAYGFKIAYSGTQGVAASTEYDLLHTGNIGNLGYVTMGDVSSCGYISAVSEGNYDSVINLQGMSKIAAGDGLEIYSGTDFIYLNNLTFVNEVLLSTNIIPQLTNTYTLGDSSYLYAATYTTNIYTPNIFDPANSNNSIKFQNGSIRFAYNDVGFYLDNSGLRPGTNGNKLLGTSSNLWGTTYTSQVNVGNNSKMYNDGGGITFSVNSNNGIRVGSSGFYPKTNKGYSIGSSTNYWSATYTENLYADTIHNFIWTGTSAEYAALSDYTTYQIYMIKEA